MIALTQLHRRRTQGQVIPEGMSVKPEIVTQRLEICQRCEKRRTGAMGVEWCGVCGTKVNGRELRLENLVAYEENLPRWGCKHPQRNAGKGWPIDGNGNGDRGKKIQGQEHFRKSVLPQNLLAHRIPQHSTLNAEHSTFNARPSLLFTADNEPVNLKNLYRGRSCFLICGGPSFAKLDHSKLRQPSILTMGVNNSAKTFRPNLWTCGDSPDHFIRSVWLDPAILKLAPLDTCRTPVFNSDTWSYLDKTVSDSPGVFFYKRHLGFDAAKFLTTDTCCWGNDDVHGGARSVMLPALRLLHYLGIRRIFLLGCDFKMDARHAYHFNQRRGADSVRGNNMSYDVLRRRFKQLRPVLESAGLRVFNCNPESKLDAFEKITFDRAVALCLEEWGNINLATERTAGLYDRPKPKPEPQVQGATVPRNKFWHPKPVIPPLGHFVWLGSPLPKMAADFIERFKKLNPGLKVKLWTKIPASMPADLRAAAKKVPLLCQQADLVRLWVLSKHGGIYLDTDIYFLRSIEELRHYENFIVQGNDARLCNAAMGFARSNPLLRLLLQKARSLSHAVSTEMTRTLFGPKLFTDFHRTHSRHLNVLPTHYFHIVHSHGSALKFIKASHEDQKRMIYERRGRITDAVQPFAVHLWGFPSETMPPQVGRSSFARTRSVARNHRSRRPQPLSNGHFHWKWGFNRSMLPIYGTEARLRKDLLALEGAWKEDRVVIWGNGSTVDEALRLRHDAWFREAKHIGTNMAMKLAVSFDAYCIGDLRFLDQPEKAAVARKAAGVKVYQSVLRPRLGDHLPVSYVKTIGREGFCSDLRTGIYHGYSVVWLAFQVALWAGTRNIFFAGCPYDYSGQPRFYKEKRPSPADDNIQKILSNYRQLLGPLSGIGIRLRAIGRSRLQEAGIEVVTAEQGLSD